MKRLLLLLFFAALPILTFGQSQNLVTGTITTSGSSCQPGATYTNCVIAAIPSGATAPAQSVGVTITGTFSGTLQFEISLDNGANWSAVNATPPNSTTAVTSTTGTGFWAISAAGGSHVRVRASALASGSATASINPSQAIVPSAGGGVSGVSSFNTRTGAVTLSASDVAGVSGCVAGSFTAQTDAATVTWAIASAPCANASLTFTVHSGSRTLNLTGLVNGGSYVLWIKQDATGGEGLTLGTGCTWKVSGGGAGAVTPSVAASAIDVLAFTYDGTNCYLNFTKNFS